MDDEKAMLLLQYEDELKDKGEAELVDPQALDPAIEAYFEKSLTLSKSSLVPLES